MKQIKLLLILLVLSGHALMGQSSLSNFELRMENGQLASATTYQFDVYLYNTGVSSFELRAGTVSFWINPSWRNSGTITPSIVSSSLVSAQQSGTSAYTNGSTDFFRRTIASASSGSGTSVAAGSRVKLFTILFTNSASFSSSATPNFAWKFSGGNSAGFTYTDVSTTASAIAVNATTVVSTQSNCYTPAYWDGTQWNSGSVSAGSVSTTAPVAGKDAIIYTGTFSGALTCRNYYLMSGGTHNLGSSTLQVGYNLVNSGTLSASAGTVNLDGTQIAQTSNQTVSGTGFTVSSLGFGASGNGGTKTLSTTLSVSGSVTQTGTAVLASGGNLTLLSSATGTAKIGQLNSGNDISGNITVERYLPASYRRYRFLASPVIGGTTLQWRDNGATNAGRGIHITHSTGTADPSISNMPSAFKYTESLSTGGTNLNSKWESIDGNTTLDNGNGYRVFVRGDRTKSLTSTTDTTPNNTTIWVSGTYPVSPVNLPITYNPLLGNGWNLVGNPFASPIDWNASSGWTKTNIAGTIYIVNPLTNTYGSFDGITSTNSVTRYIASGQAFFVQATGTSPLLNASEAVKVANTPADLFKAPEPHTLRIQFAKDAGEKDEAVIRFLDNASNNFDPKEDVTKLMNPNINIGSFCGVGKYALVNYLKNGSQINYGVPLMASVSNAGSYVLTFSQMDQFDPGIFMYLVDHLNNKRIDIRQNPNYVFVTDGTSASMADGRLEVVFTNVASSVNESIALAKPRLYVYPNPVTDWLEINWQNNQQAYREIRIMDVSGKQLIQESMAKNFQRIDVSFLPNGIYFLTAMVNGGEVSTTFKFIK